MGSLLIGSIGLIGLAGVAPSPAGADTTFTWSGGSSGSSNWSDTGNWNGGTAPADNDSGLDLNFPDLSSCSNPEACDTSTNNRNGLGLNSVDFSGATLLPYDVSGNGVTLGSGGLTATGVGNLSLPLNLTTAQSWTLDGGQVDVAGPMTSSSALAVSLGDRTVNTSHFTGIFQVSGDSEVGPVTVTSPPSTTLGVVELTAASSTTSRLNGSNGNSVTITGPSGGSPDSTHLVAGGPGTDEVGALSLGADAFVNLGSPGISSPAASPTVLHVNGGVSFTSTGGFGDMIVAPGTTAGVDYGELIATGDIDLNNAGFQVIGDTSGCPTDSEIGDSFTLLSTSGTISGQFGSGAGNGEGISLGSGCTAMMQMHYSSHEVYGTIINTTGTYSPNTVSAAPSPAVEGQTVTYTTTVATAPSSPVPTGNVVFSTSNIILCTAVLSGGTGSCSSNAAPVGLTSIAAAYSGDATYRQTNFGLQLTVESPPTPPAPPTPPTPPATPHGYWLVGSDGGIFTFGSSQFYGSTGNLKLQRPVVGISPTASRSGYWLVASDGGVFAYGDAGFVGSIPGVGLHPAGSGLPNSLAAPIVGIVPSRDGGGYFMVASDGGVFAFGDAHFAGSCPGIGGCSGAAVDVMPDASGNGYWIVTSTGNVYGFGDAAFYGSPGHGTVTSAVATPDGHGYWVLLSDGEVFAYGSATALGSAPAGNFNALDPANAIFATSDGAGYWVSSAAGAVYTFGDAPNDGSMAGTHLNGAIVAGNGY